VEPLLKVLGKRVHALRVEKGWSQEELAHRCALHRTYIGQVERGEKNISFENLTKFSGALEVTLSELMRGLETGAPIAHSGSGRTGKDSDHTESSSATRIFEVQKLIRRLNDQLGVMDRTISSLTKWADGDDSITSTSPTRAKRSARKAR
jgi:transcriptional regulator with XRE-family HTH domain